MIRIASAVLLSCLAGCSCPGAAEREALAALERACFLDSDCAREQRCAFGRCHKQCQGDLDCSRTGDLVCRPGQSQPSADAPVETHLVCLLTPKCQYNSECPGRLVCARDGVCRAPCREAADCEDPDHLGASSKVTRLCIEGTCAETAELDADGGLPASSGAVGVPCRYDSQCVAPAVCHNFLCGPQCLGDRDCASGDVCLGNVCVPPRPTLPDGGMLPEGFGASCTVPSQCKSPLICGSAGSCTVECLVGADCGVDGCCLGYRCFHGQNCVVAPAPDGGARPDGGPVECRTDRDCQNPWFCDGAEVCMAGVCHRAARVMCDDGDPCTNDLCEEAARTCMLVPQGAPDRDGDGHYPLGCIGGPEGDDCDDNDPTVYWGAPELCDFKDNNCNGAVDELLWNEDPAANAAFTNGNLYPGGSSQPQVKRIGGSLYVFAAADTTDGTIDAWELDPASLTARSSKHVLGGSATPWSSCVPTGSTVWGKRVGLWDVVTGADAGDLMVTYRTLDYPAASSCCTATMPTIRGQYVFTTPALVPFDAGVMSLAPTTGLNSCDFSIVWNHRFGAPTAAVWNPHIAAWVLLWADPWVASPPLRYALLRDGVLGTPRALWPGTPTMPAAELSTVTLGSEHYARMAVGATTLLIIWHDTGAVRAMMLDARNPNLSQVVVPPFTVPLPTPFNAESVVDQAMFVDGRYVVTLSQGANVVSLDLLELSEAGAVLSLRRLTGISVTGQPQPGFVSSGERSSFVPWGRGFFVGTTSGNTLQFGWGTWGADGGLGTQAISLGLAPNQHSDVTLVPLNDTTVAAFYADGNLRRRVLRCTP